VFEVPLVLVYVGFLGSRKGALLLTKHRVKIGLFMGFVIWRGAHPVFPFAATETHASRSMDLGVGWRCIRNVKGVAICIVLWWVLLLFFCNSWFYWTIFPLWKSFLILLLSVGLSYSLLAFHNLMDSIQVFNFIHFVIVDFIIWSNQLQLFLFQSVSILNPILLFQLLNKVAKLIARLIDFFQITIQRL